MLAIVARLSKTGLGLASDVSKTSVLGLFEVRSLFHHLLGVLPGWLGPLARATAWGGEGGAKVSLR